MRTYNQIHLSDLISKESNTYKYLQILNSHVKRLNGSLYVVGGALRDFFCGRQSNSELDCVIDCNSSLTDWKELLEIVSKELNLCSLVAIRTNPYFLTSSIRGPDLALDFTFPRSELYDQTDILNGQVTIERSDITSDTLRRDFTCNAIYGLITHNETIKIHDPLHGIDDLKDGVLRATHSNLFEEDLSRIIRLFRFQFLLKHKIDSETATQLRNAISYANKNLHRITNSILKTALGREIQLLSRTYNTHQWFDMFFTYNMRFMLPGLSLSDFKTIEQYWKTIKSYLTPTAKALSEIELLIAHFTDSCGWKNLSHAKNSHKAYTFEDLASNIKVKLDKGKVIFDNKSLIKLVPLYSSKYLTDLTVGLEHLSKNAKNLHLLSEYITAETQSKDLKAIRLKVLLGQIP